jgi:predicted nuclease of predicted toxin-antitoxin system
VNFLFDAQLPRRLAVRLRELGHDTIHTLDFPRANRTTDQEINEISVRELRTVVTKDSDFVDSLLLRRQPWKLLLVTTGNIRNGALEALFLTNLDTVIDGLATHDYVELSRSAVVLHF